MLLIMVGTSFYQTLQTQRASPQGAASQQQQMILRVMPLFFGFIGWSFPVGLVLYWTVSNLFMIGQQTLLLRAGHIGPEALERRMAEQKAKMAAQADKPQKKGFMAGMMERADEERKRRESPPAKDGKGSAGTQSKRASGASRGPRKPKKPRPGGGKRGG